ncbi:MAG: tetratricopeptide repeat protein [Methylococcales bacterium]|nr:tetratricopeptide repeat protein [Methylococcales bacterium]
MKNHEKEKTATKPYIQVNLDEKGKVKSIETNCDFDNYELGLNFYEQEEWKTALYCFNKAIEQEPNNCEAYIKRGNCYLNLRDFTKANEDFNIANKLSNNDCEESENNEYYLLAKFSDSEEHKKLFYILASNVSVSNNKYEKAEEYINKAFYIYNDDSMEDTIEIEYKKGYLKSIYNAEKIELQIEETKKANKIAHEKEKEMLSFFTHTMRNALATAPESLRQAIRLLGSEDYEKNQKHYEAINEIAALFSTITLTDCLIDTFKQSIYDTEEFKRAWQQDNAGDATPEWFIASALRQSLNRIIFMEDATGLRKLINNQGELIKPTRKAFIEQVLPLDVNQKDVEKFYHWLQSITALEVNIEKSTAQFGANQIKFSLMFAISSELILNALKYWGGTGKIQINWYIDAEYYIFSVSNACKANANSQLAGTHKGLAFINRLIELLGEHAQFNCTANEQLFSAELKLHKNLLEG